MTPGTGVVVVRRVKLISNIVKMHYFLKNRPLYTWA